MDVDTNFVAVLRDLIQFLETLSGVNLPNGLQNVRENLLQRSKTSLATMNQQFTTPEAYLDMNAGKGKGLSLIETLEVNDTTSDKQITEYMYADNSNHIKLSSCQNYYESFQANTASNSEEISNNQACNDPEEELKSIYRTFSSEQTINKALKSGPLHLKEERRLFGFQLFSGFDQFRPCFIGLVGTHLLLYATKHDKRPSDIISIRGYSARASPNAIPRDLERSKSAFEIFSPGNRTFQFTARSPKEMEQWIAVICRTGNASAVALKTLAETNTELINDITRSSVTSINARSSNEQYQDVGSINSRKSLESVKVIDFDTRNDNENDVKLREEEKLTNRSITSPPLPARIPRRLPSLPHEHQSLNFDSIDDGYDEDDIYHKIEDLKKPASTYQNIANADHNSRIDNDCSNLKRTEKMVKSKTKNSKQIFFPSVEIYDDAQPVEISKSMRIENDRTSIIYDDIQTIVNDARKEIVKETRKKSFLDRVRNKKESPQKEHIKKRWKHNKLNVNGEIVQSQRVTSQEMLSYDDAIGLGIEINQNNNDNTENYTSLSAPCTIYGKTSPIIDSVHQDKNEDFYDDIGASQNIEDGKFLNKTSQVNTIKLSHAMNDEKLSNSAMNLSKMATTNSQDESEHYQVPRSQQPIDIGGQVEVVTSMAEELYDDIAIVVNFRTRQRDSACSNPSLADKMPSSTTNAIKVWNRFASGRKSKCDSSPIEKNKRFNNDDGVNTTSFNSNHECENVKINKFQKLINKMESSLNKSRPIPAIIKKSHDDNIN
ncbi:hypothetical protein PV327_002954 [Microctonus hyperodae]|uniref:PH domain-containing protein n=1 Tax=Microctonus hyperodae TaxID=165561 RepID=A0AA39G301_MICHY|nr:hypothetical protein PV327_002954 [Microctonus hyperodae]